MEKTITTKKVTKAERNNDIIAILKGEAPQCGTTIEEAIAHLKHENELLAKKHDRKTKKLTKSQTENIEIKKNILTFLGSVDCGVIASEVMRACDLSSPQKASALLRQLEKEDKVIKVIEKGRSLFMLAV